MTTWEESAKISQALQKLLAKADEETLRFLLSEFQLQKIDSPELASTLVKIAKEKPALRSVVIDLAAGGHSTSPEMLHFLESVALDKGAD